MSSSVEQAHWLQAWCGLALRRNPWHREASQEGIYMRFELFLKMSCLVLTKAEVTR